MSEEKPLSEKGEKIINKFVRETERFYFETDVKQFIKEILNEIEKREKYHKRNYNRYIREVKKYREDKEQREYSEKRALIEINIIDEIKELKEIIKEKSGKDLVE